jgi:signal transduction histidine kinase
MSSAAEVPWFTRLWRRVPSIVPDGLLAAVLVCASIVSLHEGGFETPTPPAEEADLLAYVLAIPTAASVLFRRRWPLGVLAASLAGSTTIVLLGYPDNATHGAVFVAMYTATTRHERRTSLRVLGGVLAVLAVSAALEGYGGWDFVGEMIARSTAMVGAYLVGDNLRVRRAYLCQLELRAQDQEEKRREEAERAVAEERLRIARELHDVVAHAMSVVAVQSGVAAHVLDQRPDDARTMLATINDVSRDALDEMRRMLGVLRAGSGDEAGDGTGARAPRGAELAPAATLGDLPGLVGTVRSAGLEVDLAIDGDRAPLPAGVELSAYRIVQEALTNVLKHAGPAKVAVHVNYGAEALAVEVVDDGRGASTLASGVGDAAGGHGLVGMHERVLALGGTLDVGPRRGGGFRVAATLPR